MKFLAFAKTQFHLEPSILQIDRERNQCISHLPNFLEQMTDLTFLKKQTFRSERIRIEDIPLFIGTDVHSLNKDLTVFDDGIAFFQVHPALPHAFDLSTLQLHSAFQPFLDKIIMERFLVLSHRFYSFCAGHTSTSNRV